MEWKELPSRIYGKGVAIKEGAGHQGWSPGVKEHRGEENGLTGRLTEGLSRGGGVPTLPPNSNPYSCTQTGSQPHVITRHPPKIGGFPPINKEIKWTLWRELGKITWSFLHCYIWGTSRVKGSSPPFLSK